MVNLMKVPKKMRTYCPYCKKHTEQSVKEQKKGARRTMSWGQQKFLKKSRGYVSKVGKTIKPVKQSKKTALILTCAVCKKKHIMVMPHSKKKLEIKAGE